MEFASGSAASFAFAKSCSPGRNGELITWMGERTAFNDHGDPALA
jgi:hypothetical protein